jgi:hypothetical protein
MPRRRIFWLASVLSIIVILAVFAKVYYVRRQSQGFLFWHEKIAYFIIGEYTQGYRFSYLEFAVEGLREIFPFGASAPTDHHGSVIVLQVSPNSVRTYSADNFTLGMVEPFQGTLYVPNMLPGGRMMKWSDTHFEPATPAEFEKLHEFLISLPKGPPAGPGYDNVEGWSKRTVAGEIVEQSPSISVEKDSRVTIELDGKQLTFVMNSGFISGKAYIDLIREGQPPDRIWYLDERSNRVSRAEYKKIFEGK